jgi:hypothetical protein
VTAQVRGLKALLLCGGMLLALFPGYAPAQDVICCNHLLSFGGDWFGASRQCRGTMEKGTEAQRRSVCKQLKGKFCADVASYCQACTGDEARKRNPGGNSLGPGDPIYDGMVDGVRAAGITGFGPEHVGIQDRRERDGRLFWQIRVDAAGCPLPTGDCVLSAGENGYLPEGKQVGARQMLLGSVQFAGTLVRVNGRYVNVETGVIEGSAAGTATGNGREAIAQAMAEMLKKLGTRCQQARGLVY